MIVGGDAEAMVVMNGNNNKMVSRLEQWHRNDDAANVGEVGNDVDGKHHFVNGDLVFVVFSLLVSSVIVICVRFDQMDRIFVHMTAETIVIQVETFNGKSL